MATTAVGLKHIERKAVWVALKPPLDSRVHELQQGVLKHLQYIRFVSFGQTHLRIICERYTYDEVERVVEMVLIAMKIE